VVKGSGEQQDYHCRRGNLRRYLHGPRGWPNGGSTGKSNRKRRIRYDKEAYKGRNVVERCFCRLKDWQRIARRYDKLAQNFLSALCFVAMLAYWL
jgi:transposase